MSTHDPIIPEDVKSHLTTSWLGVNIYYVAEADSTNIIASQIACQGAPEGTVVIAECQTAGRGRLGRRWISPPGKGAWFSVVLRPGSPAKAAPQIGFVASLAVARAIRHETGLPALTKWPNDVLVNKHKVCGILTETSTKGKSICCAILGIGININLTLSDFPSGIAGTASSLLLEAGRPFKRAGILAHVLGELEKWYETWSRQGFDPVRKEWKTLSETLNRRVTVIDNDERFEGQALDIDQEGALLVAGPDGIIKRFAAGDVSLRLVVPGDT